ncbi:AlpA family phage regulatory protein [Pararhizobium sp. BT-229]|uniref:helix-turn-helix transcriptional regulator n=1 Tax=Pararhizobium sp. BT-229 TaxID=2986923 RepID=UPI0021F7C312|nr:AlpA family phage regulatory protein [Pararhizobium sp. BT-229]MCV9960353.1 AlpA family phage regulatory protein [Pararhizobium sp. BT-229]
MIEKMYSAEEIYRPRGQSASSFYRAIREGKFPPGEKVGLRSVRWRESVVEAADAARNPGHKKALPAPPEPRASRTAPVAATPRPAARVEPAMPDSDIEAAALWLSAQETPPRPVIPALRALFGFSPLEACAVAARAFDLRTGGGAA